MRVNITDASIEGVMKVWFKNAPRKVKIAAADPDTSSKSKTSVAAMKKTVENKEKGLSKSKADDGSDADPESE